MKVKITAENYEEIVNKLTLDLILRNGKLEERLEKREWLTNTEFLNYFNDMDVDSIMALEPYAKKNEIERFEIGSTYMNLFDQYAKLIMSLMLLKNKGKKTTV